MYWALALTALATGLIVWLMYGLHRPSHDPLAESSHRKRLEVQLNILLFEHEDQLVQRLSQRLRPGPYGLVETQKAYAELRYFFTNVVLPRTSRQFELDEAFLWSQLCNWFDYHREEGTFDAELATRPRNDGLSYETKVAGLLAASGFNVQYTPASGDQGVDLLATKGPRRIAVQCKNSERPAGNDAIQQVYAGAKFYRSAEAIVVAPNGFTVGAQELAHSIGVRCLHHEEIESAFGDTLGMLEPHQAVAGDGL